MRNEPLNFNALVSLVEQTHQHFQEQAVKAVNISLTIRNWLVGYYIVEFEQKGEDRASYGEKLLKSISDKLSSKGLSETNLKLARQFYQTYPQIGSFVKSNFLDYLPISLSQSSTDLFQNIEIKSIEISQTTSDLFEIDKSPAKPDNYNKQILERISFSHFVELMKIEDNTKRTFYELQTLKTTLSVKELKRQINTLAYERVGISSNTEIALEQLQSTIEPTNSNDAIKSIYTFDFLGLKSDSLLEEKDLEGLLLDHLQEFIQELGYGFCFEHRQKRLLFDDDYFFADLVFYHRILKCHVIVELKVDAFKHEYLSQLNTYVAYYNANVKREDDNRAIGILLCTEKGKQLVEYATAGMDNNLFVSKYLLELPKKEELAAFIQKEISGLR